MARPSSFTFVFPYRPVSGVPVLFARLARALAAQGVPCRVVDYPDGCLARAVAGVPGIELLPFEDGRPLALGPDGLVVMQAILPATMHRELQVHPDTRVLFWVLHVMNFVQVIVPFAWTRDWQARSLPLQRLANRTVLRGFQRVLRRLVLDLARAGSLAFMDGSTWEGTRERLDIDLPAAAFVPVILEVPAANPRVPPGARTGPRRIAWLGRLADFKIGILNHTIATLERVAAAEGRPVEMVVIGDGPLASELRMPASTHVRIERVGTLTGDALAARLAAMDVLFAMGTSALEGARLGVPTVLLDFSYGRVPHDYRFRWLADARDFELGRLIDASLRGEPSEVSVTRILAELDADPGAVSNRTFDYCRARHSIESGLDAFLAAAASASYRMGAIDPALRRKSWLRRRYEWARRLRSGAPVPGVPA